MIGLQAVTPTAIQAIEISTYVYLDDTLRTQLRNGAQTSYVRDTLQTTISNTAIPALGWQIGSETTVTFNIPTHSVIVGNGNDWIARIGGNSWMGVTEYRQMYYGNAPGYVNTYSISSINTTSTSTDISVSNNYSINGNTLVLKLTIKRLKESSSTSYPITIAVNNLTLGSTVVAPNQNQSIFPPDQVENITGLLSNQNIVLPVEQKVAGAPVTVKYQDENGNSLNDSVVLTGAVGESWQAEEKSFAGYERTTIIGATSGVFDAVAREVIFVYQKNKPGLERLGISTSPVRNWHKGELIKLADGSYYVNSYIFSIAEYIYISFAESWNSYQVIIRDSTGVDRSSWFSVVDASSARGRIEITAIRDSAILTNQEYSIEIYGKINEPNQAISIDNAGFFVFGKPGIGAVGREVVQGGKLASENILLKAAEVHISYVNETGENLIEKQIEYGVPGDSYTTQEKEFEGYRLKEVRGNSQGEFSTETTSEVSYVYEKNTGILEIKSLEGFDFDFGEIKPTSRKQVIAAKGETMPQVTISDYSDATTWSLQVSASPFVNASGQVLTGATMTLNNIQTSETVHQQLVVTSELPLGQTAMSMIEMTQPTLNHEVENGVTKVKVGEARNNELTGVMLTLPANTPTDVGAYQAKMTWELVGDPTLGGHQ